MELKCAEIEGFSRVLYNNHALRDFFASYVSVPFFLSFIPMKTPPPPPSPSLPESCIRVWHVVTEVLKLKAKIYLFLSADLILTIRFDIVLPNQTKYQNMI